MIEAESQHRHWRGLNCDMAKTASWSKQWHGVGTVHSGASNPKPSAEGPTVQARGIFQGHDDTVEDVQFCPSRETDRSRGFGFVTMSTVEEAKTAIVLSSRYSYGNSLSFKQESTPDKSILKTLRIHGLLANLQHLWSSSVSDPRECDTLKMEGTTSQTVDSNEMENMRATLEAMTRALERLSTEVGAIRGEVTTISGRLEQVESQRNSRPSTP
ncbi:hypothetical protein FXO37_24746 [Capsicum annuum]|nr:hypothetical protein FXO37_24746 [Capsicum annuum]